MEKHFEWVIMIPTYNEEKRMPLKKYFDFLRRHDDVMLCFVNDGSTNNTKIILQNIELSALKHIEVIEHKKNRGKAAAVMSGFLFLRHQRSVWQDSLFGCRPLYFT